MGHTEINAFGDTSSGCALGQGTLRSDSGGRLNAAPERRRNLRPSGRGGCQTWNRIQAIAHPVREVVRIHLWTYINKRLNEKKAASA